MLQSLLQPRGNVRVTVRHELDRKKRRRPSQLPLQQARPGEPDATPSPDHSSLRNDLYVCGRVALLHGIVGSLLLGIVLLVVGLVQLSPGAEAAQHRFYLLGAGAALTAVGVVTAIFRCVCLHWLERGCCPAAEQEEAHEPAVHHKPAVGGVSVVGQDKERRDRPRLQPQPGGPAALLKQASADA